MDGLENVEANTPPEGSSDNGEEEETISETPHDGSNDIEEDEVRETCQESLSDYGRAPAQVQLRRGRQLLIVHKLDYTKASAEFFNLNITPSP